MDYIIGNYIKEDTVLTHGSEEEIVPDSYNSKAKQQGISNCLRQWSTRKTKNTKRDDRL